MNPYPVLGQGLARSSRIFGELHPALKNDTKGSPIHSSLDKEFSDSCYQSKVGYTIRSTAYDNPLRKQQ